MSYERLINYLLDQIEERNTTIERLTYTKGFPPSPKPAKETSKLKPFMDVFNALSGTDRADVEETPFIYELIKTGKFTEAECYDYLRRAQANGQIYECKTGFYAKA